MKIDPNLKSFPGQVRYSGINQGTISWKSGQLVFTKENGSWKLEMQFDCSNGRPVLTLNLCDSKIKKVICKESGFVLDYRKDKGDMISVSYRPAHKSVVKSLQSIMDEIKSPKQEISFPKCEVGTKQASTTPAKSPLWSTTSSNIAENSGPRDTSPQSVKEHKKSERQLDEFSTGDEKENLYVGSLNKSGNKFLQRSAEKSQSCISSQGFYGKQSSHTQPLHNSTPKPGWLNAGKRQPGLMPDPTPPKRQRLSDSISYSMKTNSTLQANPKQAQALQGFSNLGNTCYMNSILQSLFGLDTLSNDLMANRKLLKVLPPQSLYTALVKLLHVKRMQTSADLTRRECLKRVKCAISNSAKRFLGYGQHDAHEFLGQVLDQLKEEVIKINKSTPSPNKEPVDTDISPDIPGVTANPIISNFEFEVVHSLTCVQCGECVMKAEQFHDISLDLPKHKDRFTPRSLQDALSLFFKNEEIEYACEKCNHTKSFVTHKVTRLPRIFILHLKRYLYNQTFSKNTKMGQNVAIPLYITLQNHCTEQTQPAYPPYYPATGNSEQKNPSELDDSREDAPSRRKLEYPGYKFKQTGLSSSAVKQEDAEDDKMDKKDEVDSMQPRPLTLEDEEDPDFARAIEMSLKEHEEKDKMARDFGEDTEENFERVVELSRQETDNDITSKDLKDLSEEEMIQLAIEQSLRDSHATYAQTDVTDNGHHNYTQVNDVTTDGHHKYTQIDDVTGKGLHNYSKNSSGTSHSTSVSLDSDSYDIGPDQENKEPSHKTYGKKSRVVREKDIADELFCTETMPDEAISSVQSEKLKSDNADTQTNLQDESVCEIMEGNNSKGEKNKRSWKDRLNNLSSRFSDDGTELADGDTSECLDNAIQQNKANRTSESLRKGNVYEVWKKQKCDSECDDSNNCNSTENCIDLTAASSVESETNDLDYELNLSATDCDKDAGEGAETSGFCEMVEAKEDKKAPLERKCQLGNKGGNSEKPKVANKADCDFDCDEDDLWMLNVEDKENKLPSTEKPQLSSPDEFNQDMVITEADEVDSYVEESLDLPEIKNEKGDLPYSYRLVSIVNHMGLSSTTGHYLSDVYNMKKKGWYSFDDSHVTKITEEDVKAKRERSGYIFFYMNKDIFDDVGLQNDLVSSDRNSTTN